MSRAARGRTGGTSARSKVTGDPRAKPKRAGETTLFGAKLREFRERAGKSQTQLGKETFSSASHLSNIERGHSRASQDFATKMDEHLKAGGELLEAFTMDTATLRPRELPVGPGLLIGREQHLAALTEMAGGKAKRDRATSSGTPAIVVIEGLAGAGKSALAIRWAHAAASEFAGGQLYADLRGHSADGGPAAAPEEVLDAFCATLSPGTPIPPGRDAKAKLFRTLLAKGRFLIVLDNAESDDQVEPLLPANDGCSIVITSRRTLGHLSVHRDVHRIRVGPLNHEDAQDVIGALIGPARAAAEHDAVASLARLCGGLPLALRVAAHLLATQPARSVASLVEEIHEDGGPLIALDTDDMPSPRRALSRSCQDLDPDAARAYQLLAHHPGPPLAIAALAALWGRSSRESRQILRHLAAVNLVEMTHDNAVLIHDLPRAHAQELLDQDPAPRDDRDDRNGQPDAVRRLILWYLHTAGAVIQMLAPDPPPDLPLIDDTAALLDLNPRVFADDDEAYRWCDTNLQTLIALSDLTTQHESTRALHPLVTATIDILVGRPDRSTEEHPTPQSPERTERPERPERTVRSAHAPMRTSAGDHAGHATANTSCGTCATGAANGTVDPDMERSPPPGANPPHHLA